MSNAPILAGVVGWPIEHSMSPVLHAFWAARAGINGYYVPIAVEPAYEDFARAMDALATVGFAGVNITLPHKAHALRYAMEQGEGASETATRAGAANMLTFGENGAFADNSDAMGFQKALERQLGAAPAQTSALMLGAGGASRGVVLALRNLGFADIAIANRTRDKAEAIAAEFGLGVVDWERRNDALAATDVVVNATSLGMTGQPPLDLAVEQCRPDAIICDIIYSPLETPLLKTAKARGHRIVDGLDMLMNQAVPAFEAWFGATPQVDNALRAALVAELKRRGRA